MSRHGWQLPDWGEREPREPAELLEIQADDALLGEIAVGRRPGPPWADSGFADERRMVGTLCAWRDEVWAEPIPELLPIEGAMRAVISGRRRPRRRLVPVAAAALVVLAGGGLLYGGSLAGPGNPLLGVSGLLDAGRADDRVAVQVDAVLAAVRQALAQGRVLDARRLLDRAVPLVDGVADPRRRDDLTRMRANLTHAAREGLEGRPVHTDERGVVLDGDPEGNPDPAPRERRRPEDGGHVGRPAHPGRLGGPHPETGRGPGPEAGLGWRPGAGSGSGPDISAAQDPPSIADGPVPPPTQAPVPTDAPPPTAPLPTQPTLPTQASVRMQPPLPTQAPPPTAALPTHPPLPTQASVRMQPPLPSERRFGTQPRFPAHQRSPTHAPPAEDRQNWNDTPVQRPGDSENSDHGADRRRSPRQPPHG